MLSNLLGHTFAKVCALVFLALILIPFTAPFRTIDLAGSHSDRAHDGLPKDKTGSDDKVAPSAASLGPQTLMIVTVKAVARVHQIQEPPRRLTILRI
jgi:hypothetical protein